MRPITHTRKISAATKRNRIHLPPGSQVLKEKGVLLFRPTPSYNPLASMPEKHWASLPLSGVPRKRAPSKLISSWEKMMFCPTGCKMLFPLGLREYTKNSMPLTERLQSLHLLPSIKPPPAFGQRKVTAYPNYTGYPVLTGIDATCLSLRCLLQRRRE